MPDPTDGALWAWAKRQADLMPVLGAIITAAVLLANNYVDGRVDTKLNAYAKTVEVDTKVVELKSSVATLQNSVTNGFMQQKIDGYKQQIAALDRQIAERELLINNSTGATRDLHITQLNTLQRAKDVVNRDLDQTERERRQMFPQQR